MYIHRSECPVIFILLKKENYTRNGKRTLTGLIQAACSVSFLGDKQ